MIQHLIKLVQLKVEKSLGARAGQMGHSVLLCQGKCVENDERGLSHENIILRGISFSYHHKGSKDIEGTSSYQNLLK